LFEVANDAILIMYNQQVIDCNDRTLEVFGCKREEILGDSLIRFSPDFQPDGIPSTEKLSARFKLVDKGISQFFYWRNQRTDGSSFDSEVSVNLFNFGEKSFYQVIIRDITARMKAEMALRESEERFKLLANSTIEGITFSEDGKIIDCNDQFAFLHGYDSRKEVIGKNLTEFFHPDDENVLQQRTQSNDEELIEIRGIRKDNSLMWLDSKGKYIPYGSKKIRVTVTYDITDRKKFEDGLLKSKQAYETLVEGSPYGIFIHKEGSVVYANNAAFEIVGLEKEEFYPGKYSMYDFMLPEFINESHERRNALLRGEEVPFIRIRIRDLSGGIQDIETKSQLITYNEELAIQTTFKNISVELQLEKEKMRAEIAEQTNKTLAEEIQQHKQTQRKLLEAQQYTQNIIGSSIDMIIATDGNNRINEANPAALSTFGYEKEELLGQYPEILYADARDFDKVKASLDSTGHFSGEILNRRKNGELFTSYISASPIRNNDGEIVGAMGVSRDISEIIEAEKIVQEQNAKIKSIFENSSNLLIWTLDKNFRISSFNKNFKEIIENKFGVEIFIGREFMPGLQQFIDATVFPKTYDKYDQAFKGQPQELEGPLQNINGSMSWFETYLNPIKLESGEIEEISCVSHEVTEKKLAQLELRRSEERNKAMINALPDLIFRMNNEGTVLDVVYKSEYQLVEASENLVGKRIQERYPDEIGHSFIKNVRAAIDDNNVMQLEYELGLNGSKGAYEARFARINEEEALVIIRDITEKKEAEENLLASLKEKEVLLKEVHHRVKNNLQVISSILNLQSSYVKDENTLQILRESQNRIKSMSFIHESLYQTKNFSSINFSEYVINLSKNLVHSYQVYSNLIDVKFGVGLVNLNLDQAIPCGLIINELVSNALKYAFNEGQEGTIFIRLAEKEGIISLSVEDNGKGLPEGFDHTATETLGLQLVVTLVEQLEGSMDLQSSAQSGTKYLITFEKLN
jgi:PAS domain S-box-containing protein